MNASEKKKASRLLDARLAAAHVQNIESRHHEGDTSWVVMTLTKDRKKGVGRAKSFVEALMLAIESTEEISRTLN